LVRRAALPVCDQLRVFDQESEWTATVRRAHKISITNTPCRAAAVTGDGQMAKAKPKKLPNKTPVVF